MRCPMFLDMTRRRDKLGPVNSRLYEAVRHDFISMLSYRAALRFQLGHDGLPWTVAGFVFPVRCRAALLDLTCFNLDML